jgi:hypothetical protein
MRAKTAVNALVVVELLDTELPLSEESVGGYPVSVDVADEDTCTQERDGLTSRLQDETAEGMLLVVATPHKGPDDGPAH